MYRAAVQTVRYEGVCRMDGWMEHVTVYGAMDMAHETLKSTMGSTAGGQSTTVAWVVGCSPVAVKPPSYQLQPSSGSLPIVRIKPPVL